jgi:hypothetical protein
MSKCVNSIADNLRQITVTVEDGVQIWQYRQDLQILPTSEISEGSPDTMTTKKRGLKQNGLFERFRVIPPSSFSPSLYSNGVEFPGIATLNRSIYLGFASSPVQILGIMPPHHAVMNRSNAPTQPKFCCAPNLWLCKMKRYMCKEV